jgi:uncharacterized membrane protein YagU involved in acid resistance
MKWFDLFKRGLVPGALAGLIGGLVFGATMLHLGMLPTIASLVRADSTLIGLLVHMVIAASIGSGFGVLVWQQHLGAGETLFWGLTYGTLWWFLGPLTLMPLLLGSHLAWDIQSAQAAFPSLLGHLLYGMSTGFAFVLLRQERWFSTSPWSRGMLLRGALAGLGGAWLLTTVLNVHDEVLLFSATFTSTSHTLAWLFTALIGLVVGISFALLYPHPTGSAGPGLIRGAVYGFVWWVVGALTVLPLLAGTGLAWSLEAVRAGFAMLPAYVLLGAAVALAYQWLTGVVRILFTDNIPSYGDEGIGMQGIQAVARGAVAGVVGGLLFTLVMVQVGLLPVVANVIGATAALTGFLVHLVIAILIGASYGLLFRRQSYDIASALGWGVSYGFVWWVLGGLTLMPLLLSTEPQWTVEAAGELLPSLIGHLVYGAGLGVTFYLLEVRYSPWWMTRTQAEAARVARRKEQVLTSAPALWVLVVMIALTLPVMLHP